MAVLVGRVSPKPKKQAEGRGIVAGTGPVQWWGLPSIYIKARVSLEEGLGPDQPSCRQITTEATLSALATGGGGHGTLGRMSFLPEGGGRCFLALASGGEPRELKIKGPSETGRLRYARKSSRDTSLLLTPARIPSPSKWENPAPATTVVGSFGPGLCCPQAVILGTARGRGKARRLKQAKEEAQMEVEQYRREREQEFQSKQQAAMGSQGNLSAEVEQATRRQVQGMQSSQQRNRERVLAQLLGMVCDVRPQVHPNYRIAA